MLILFDVDGTLLLTEKAGILAMRDAGRELFGAEFTEEGVEFSGRLDPLIWQDLAHRNGVDNPDSHHDIFRATYRKHLTARFEAGHSVHSLPGVAELLDALRHDDAATLGLLTGNYPETGRLKFEAAGIDPDQFPIAAWGIDGPTRRDLPPVAMRHYHEVRQRPIAGEQVIIIGDTPYDVDCAKHHGLRAIGVATGAYSVVELQSAGADLAVQSLAETDRLLDWMLASV